MHRVVSTLRRSSRASALLALVLTSCGAIPEPSAVDSGAPGYACSEDDFSGCVAMAVRAGPEHPEERGRAARILKGACDHSAGASCVDLLALALSEVPWLRVIELGTATQDLKGHKIVLLGRPFVVERFAIETRRVTEAWSITAGWTTSDGVRIWVDFQGPLDALKTTLRSSSPLSDTEILSRMLLDAGARARGTSHHR